MPKTHGVTVSQLLELKDGAVCKTPARVPSAATRTAPCAYQRMPGGTDKPAGRTKSSTLKTADPDALRAACANLREPHVSRAHKFGKRGGPARYGHRSISGRHTRCSATMPRSARSGGTTCRWSPRPASGPHEHAREQAARAEALPRVAAVGSTRQRGAPAAAAAPARAAAPTTPGQRPSCGAC